VWAPRKETLLPGDPDDFSDHLWPAEHSEHEMGDVGAYTLPNAARAKWAAQMPHEEPVARIVPGRAGTVGRGDGADRGADNLDFYMRMEDVLGDHLNRLRGTGAD
jgi:hypothetical protein